MKKYRWKPPRWMKGALVISLILILHSVAVESDYPEVKEIEDKKEEVKEEEKSEEIINEIPVETETITYEERETKDYIEETALSYGLDPDIVKALIQVESGGNEQAIGDGCNSYGLMQIQPKWHYRRMERLGVEDLLDGQQNVLVGCDLLSELLEKYGTYESALTAYNCGIDNGSRVYANKVLALVEA